MKGIWIASFVIFIFLFSISLVQAVSFFGNSPICYWGPPLTCFMGSAINIDQRINLYTNDGYSINSDLCKNQIFKISGNPSGDWSGEWVQVTGGIGSPPIFWVDELKNIKWVEKDIPVYSYMSLGCESTDSGTSLVGGNVVCEKPRLTSLRIDGAYSLGENNLGESVFRVNSTESVNISIDEPVNCVSFQRCASGKYVIYDRAVLHGFSEKKIGSIIIKKSFRVSEPDASININPILTNDKLSYGSSTYLKLEVKNDGNVIIDYIKNIKFNTNAQFITCVSKKLYPGNSTECIIWVSPKETSILTADVTYQYYECGKKHQKTESFFVGEIEIEEAKCTNDKDCSENYICCTGICYDSGEGMCSDVNADGLNEWVSYN